MIDPIEIRRLLSAATLAATPVATDSPATTVTPLYSDAGAALELGTLSTGQTLAGVQILCVPGSKAGLSQNTADDYEFHLNQDQTLQFSLKGTMLPESGSLQIFDADWNSVPMLSNDGGDSYLVTLSAGDYYIEIGGWSAADADQVGYNLDFRTASPAISVNLQLSGSSAIASSSANSLAPQISLPTGVSPGTAIPAVYLRSGDGSDPTVFQVARSTLYNTEPVDEFGSAGLSALADRPIGSNGERPADQARGIQSNRNEFIDLRVQSQDPAISKDNSRTGDLQQSPAGIAKPGPTAMPATNKTPASLPNVQPSPKVNHSQAPDQQPAATGEAWKLLDAVFRSLPADRIESSADGKSESAAAHPSLQSSHTVSRGSWFAGMTGVAGAGMLVQSVIWEEDAGCTAVRRPVAPTRSGNGGGKSGKRSARLAQLEQFFGLS